MSSSKRITRVQKLVTNGEMKCADDCLSKYVDNRSVSVAPVVYVVKVILCDITKVV